MIVGCPVCSFTFGTRLRVISHLSDRRRPKCRDRVIANEVAELPADVVTKLNDRVRVLKRLALRQGHTHVLAVGAAKDPNGRIVGRVLA